MALLLGILAALVVANAIISSWVNRAAGLSRAITTVLYAPLTNASWYVFGVGTSSASVNNYLYSTDTSSWTTGSLPVSSKWQPAAYNGTRIMLFDVNSSTTALTTTNGTTWTSVTMAVSITAGQAFYDGTRFIVSNTGSNTTPLVYSTDGLTSWTAVDNGNSNFAIGYDGTSRHIATQKNTASTAYTTTTGITVAGNWSSITLPASDDWQQVLYGGGYWVIVAIGGNIAYSTNGTTWTANATQSNVFTWVYANSKFYTFTSGASTSYRYRDTPAATATTVTMGTSAGSPNSAAFADGKIVVATDGTGLWVGV
jgi:hypothetical protein